MGENYETRAVRDLKDWISGADKARDKAAVDKLLELSKQAPAREPEHENPLVNEILRQVKR